MGRSKTSVYASGFALSETGREQASMGIAVGDYDNDGKVDFYLTNFSDDYNTLFHNEGGGNFLDLLFSLEWASRPSPFSPGAQGSLILITMAGRTFLWQMATSTSWWTSSTGARPGPSGLCYFET